MTVPLPRTFFERPVLEVAPDLLGCELEHVSPEGVVRVRLTEVEAYAGPLDPGSHAYRGRTARTAVMFGPAGHLYVYFSYGMHWCVNLVCGSVGTASAVLLRAGEVVRGADLAASRRAGAGRPAAPGGALPHREARGPARLARAVGITGELTGLDFCAEQAPVRLWPATDPAEPAEPGEPVEPAESTDPTKPAGAALVRTGPRVGVSGAGGDGATYPWRFWLDGDRTVSPYRPGQRRGPAAP